MRRTVGLALASMLILPPIAHAQSNGREPTSQPSPPPLPHSAQNPAPSPTPPPPSTPGPTKPSPGGNALHGLVGYKDAQVQAGPDEIEPPVTGYGNEALWDVGSALDNSPATDPPDARQSSDATGSTPTAPNR